MERCMERIEANEAACKRMDQKWLYLWEFLKGVPVSQISYLAPP